MIVSIAVLINLVIISVLYLIKKNGKSMKHKGIFSFILCTFSVLMYAYIAIYVGIFKISIMEKFKKQSWKIISFK